MRDETKPFGGTVKFEINPRQIIGNVYLCGKKHVAHLIWTLQYKHGANTQKRICEETAGSHTFLLGPQGLNANMWISRVMKWKCNCLDWNARHPCAVAMHLRSNGGALTGNFHTPPQHGAVQTHLAAHRFFHRHCAFTRFPKRKVKLNPKIFSVRSLAYGPLCSFANVLTCTLQRSSLELL